MEQMDDLGTVTIIKDGKEVECEILFTFENEKFRKLYIGYTDHSRDETNRENIYYGAIRVDIDYDKLGYNSLEPVTNPEEVELVQEVLNEITDVATRGESK